MGVSIFLVAIGHSLAAQETDPISIAVQKEKNQQLGINLNPNEQRELERINTKYAINEKELELRSRQMSGQKLGIFDKFRIGKSNRKDYLRAKKLERFNRKVILDRQDENTKKRMLEKEKKIKKRDKKFKREQRRKRIFNLFK